MCSSDLIQYITNENVTLASGQTECEVLCTAMENGESFNGNNKLYYLLRTMEKGDPEYREDILDIL